MNSVQVRIVIIHVYLSHLAMQFPNICLHLLSTFSFLFFFLVSFVLTILNLLIVCAYLGAEQLIVYSDWVLFTGSIFSICVFIWRLFFSHTYCWLVCLDFNCHSIAYLCIYGVMLSSLHSYHYNLIIFYDGFQHTTRPLAKRNNNQ